MAIVYTVHVFQPICYPFLYMTSKKMKCDDACRRHHQFLVFIGLAVSITYFSAVAVATYAAKKTVPGSYTYTNWGASYFNEKWNGGGFTSWANSTLTEEPKTASSTTETYSAFQVSTKALRMPYRVRFTMTTNKQLRQNSTPNPWEVAWFAFAYKPDGRFKYLILKPDGYGIELGESLLNDQQNFLWTSPFGQDQFPVATTYNVEVRAENNMITMLVNGQTYLIYTLSSKDILDLNGALGLYTEDARVQFSNVQVSGGN